MNSVTRSAVVTLVFFFIPSIFVIRPLSFHVTLPLIAWRQKVTIGLMTAPITAIAVLWASQCIGATQIWSGIVGTDNIKPYNILITFISLAYMAITLDITGGLQAAAIWVSNKSGPGGRKLHLYLYVLITLISILVGNNSLILSITSFMARHMAATGLHPYPWLISEFAAANIASMVLFAGNPTNAIICETLGINHTAFTAYTVIPFVACSIACYLALILQYRKESLIPPDLDIPGRRNPREVLLDPVSAIVGTIWLATCLIVLIALSFSHVDVWKIALPFVGGKIIFDICWDHYRYSAGKIPRFEENKSDDINSADDSMVIELRRANSERMQHTPTPKPSTPSPQHHEDTSGNASQQLESSVYPFLNNNLQRAPVSTTPPRATSSISTLHPLHWLFPNHKKLTVHFPTFFTALPRLPLTLIPFTFSQFILVEALAHQGWIDIFARWLVTASNKQPIPVVWLVGVFGVILCNVSGTSIGATILLTKVIQASDFPESTLRAAAVSLTVASNIGAVSFTSASLGGLLWVAFLKAEKVEIQQWRFAMWNTLPLVAMMGAGLGVVSAMMAVLY